MSTVSAKGRLFERYKHLDNKVERHEEQDDSNELHCCETEHLGGRVQWKSVIVMSFEEYCGCRGLESAGGWDQKRV